jgi:hypothetical protein
MTIRGRFERRDGFRRRAPVALGRRQRGQSLVEMAIACIVLVPLGVGVTLLGQYIHIKQQAQSAARAAAWAATVDPGLVKESLPGKSGVATNLRMRQFADTSTAIGADDKTPSKFADPMLTTFAGRELLKPGGVTLSIYKQEKSSGYLEKAMGIVSAATDTLGNLPPNGKGLVTAEVHVKPEKIIGGDGSALAFLDPMDKLQLDFSARTVLLADTWDAAGGGEKDGKGISGASERTVRHVIQGLVPTAALGDKFDSVASDVTGILGKIPIVNELFTPNLDKFRLGRMAPDVIPTDKLVKYESAH